MERIWHKFNVVSFFFSDFFLLDITRKLEIALEFAFLNGKESTSLTENIRELTKCILNF